MRTQQAATATTRQALQHRGVEATRSLRQVLHLPTDVNDTSILGTALAEVVAEESRGNPQLAQRIRMRYDELMGLQALTPKRATRAASAPLPPLVPIRRIEGGYRHDPLLPPDPPFLIELYGRNQLARALQDYMVESLKRTAADLERKYPGTKPKNRGQRDALITYIVEHS